MKEKMKHFSFAVFSLVLWTFATLLPLGGAEKTPLTPGAAMPMIFHAVQTLRGVAKVSDLVEMPQLDQKNHVYLKLETQQNIGAFKVRGAYFMMSKLSAYQRSQGVATCSAGNHAQGVGFAADEFDMQATIFLPSSTPKKKINAVKSYQNVNAILVDGSFNDAKIACEKFVQESGAIYVPPYDHVDIIAGQGTIGWEIMHQLPQADAVLVPIGGGGLISGIALAVKGLNPQCRVIGVQSVSSNAMALSMQEGKVVALDKVSTVADGTAVARPGDITFEVCKNYVDEIVTVTEEDIKNAIRVLYKECNVTAEGAGALPVAAVLSGKFHAEGKNIVCVVSGGNIDPDLLQSIVSAGNQPQKSSHAVSTDQAPAAIGPYSQAIQCGNFLYLSGQIALNPADGQLVGTDIQSQTEQVMKNIQAILTAAGYDATHVVKTTCFLSDINDFAAFNEIYGKFFTGKPARSCVGVAALPKNALVEVEVIAYKE